jgi:hypothetical protein
MTIDLKELFRNKNHRQRKINDLGRLESRGWVKVLVFYTYSTPQLIQVLSTLLIGKHQIPGGASGRFYQHIHYQQDF